MLHPMFHTDPAQALAATRRLDEIDASVVLPGHGSALRMSLADALETLRCRSVGLEPRSHQCNSRHPRYEYTGRVLVK
jgi:glyoxylase-like metal-dependent hydrolase (beta-lactamase superfamily II)